MVSLYPQDAGLGIKSSTNVEWVKLVTEAVARLDLIRQAYVLDPAQSVVPVMAHQLGFNAQLIKPLQKCAPASR